MLKPSHFEEICLSECYMTFLNKLILFGALQDVIIQVDLDRQQWFMTPYFFNLNLSALTRISWHMIPAPILKGLNIQQVLIISVLFIYNDGGI